MTKTARTILGVVITLAIGACAADMTKGPGLPPPELAGKADFADRVTMKGALGLEETDHGLAAERSAEFTEDLEFHGFELRARAGSNVRLEVTQRGSSRGLDTVLYFYGPHGPQGYASRLAMDDDAGWGDLSRLDDLILPETGDYLVVVGTHDGIGRGLYNLAATCLSGDCLDVEVTDTCPTSVEASIRECVDEYLNEGDFQDTRRDGFVTCTSDYEESHYEIVCGGPSTPEDFCLAGYEAFRETIMPACLSALDGAFPEDDTPLGFRYRGALGPEIEARLALSSSDCCNATGDTTEVIAPASGETVTLDWVVDSIRQADDMPALWSTNPESSVSEFKRQAASYELGDDFVALLADNAGTDSFRVGHLDANWYPAAGAEAWEDLFIFMFDNGVVTTVRFSSGET